MRFSYTAAALAALTGQAAAHARVYALWQDGVEVKADGKAGLGSYIRSPPNNNPVKDITSKDIVCNADPSAKDSFAAVKAGSKLEFEWYHNTRNDDYIDGSHKGPLQTYIAKYTEGDGTGAIWTKIAEEKYDGTWPVTKMIANKGKSQAVTLPADLAGGKYLIRHEIIAHHESDTTYDVNSARGAQFYPSCIQIEVTGSGSAVPPQNFDFQTGYKYSDSGIHFNLYNDDATTYKAPGPEVWTGGSSSGGNDSSPAPTTTAAAASSAAATPTTLATQVASSAAAVTSAPAVATTSAAAAPSATPSKAPSSGCKRRRAARKARRSAH
ncbi:glycosyl hydrolase family 61 [Colletotrichum karsti]|uniref:lytic cellulose monooxygenase (C4-dehydrogenating) n=1 Tax=Colletotrichum karsti TaxID=1095194 RepID=A0A9P6LEZ8_9PEZI|nr:glycosyl hydrolase family 61 [Colletotrichum karsti]KAF9870646.1 glycosyl hydrolase family 61 [Colletotrichum karsti]